MGRDYALRGVVGDQLLDVCLDGCGLCELVEGGVGAAEVDGVAGLGGEL